MKKIIVILAVTLSVLTATAQTLNVTVGDVTYVFPAAQTGQMTYEDGTSLTVMGRSFDLSTVSSMTVDDTKVTSNLVTIVYSGATAKVTVAGNVARYVTPSVSGAHVTIDQTNTDAVDDEEITYQLSGATTDGSFALSGAYKCTVALAGVTLTNPGGAAIDITNGKRIQISAKSNTVNTLADGSNGEQKACIYSKGQIQLQGSGTLNVTGNTNHAIKSGDYIAVKNLTLNISAAMADGINCEEYFQMKSGTVTISGTGDDAIQCDLGGDTSTGETADHEDEVSGNVYLEAGKLTISNSADDGKGIKAEGDIRISGGSISVSCRGHEAIESKGVLTVTDGVVYAFSSTEDAINSASHLYLKGGSVTAVSNGNDGIDANGNMYISGGTVIACGAGQPECGLDAAERYNLYITGGTVLAIGGGNNSVTATSGSQCLLSTTGSATAGTAVTVSNGTTSLASFTIPTGYSPASGGFGGSFAPGRPGGGGQGGSGSYSYLLSCPGLTSGTSYTVTIGSASASCKAATSYSGR